MDDKLKKRLAGAAVVLLAGFALVSLLPQPGEAPPPADTQVVTIPLQSEQIATVEPPPSDQATPPSLQAPATAETPAQLSPAEMEAAAGGDDDAVPETAPAVSAPAPPPPPKNKPSGKPATPAIAAAPSAKPALPSAPPAHVTTATAPKAAAPAMPEAPAAPPAKAPVVAATPTPAPAPVARAEPASPSGGNWFVQIGGYADIANARQSQKQVQSKNLSCIIAPVDTNKGTIYRVRAGPFKSREAAQAAQTRLGSAGFSNTTLVAP